MKQILLLSFALYFLNNNNQKVYVNIHINNQKDSFYYYYNILDSVNKKNRYDTSIVVQAGVKFMERWTGIKAHSDGDYIGWYCFTNKDLIIWKEWHERHPTKIKKNL